MSSISRQHIGKQTLINWEQVGEQDIYEEDWLEKPPTLVQEIPVAGNGGITMEKIQWSEHDPSIMECWKSLRSGLRMFLHAVSNAIDILVEHFSSMDLAKVTKKRDDAFRMGWREPDFLSTSVSDDLKTRRMIINPERFLYSRANMNPNPIEVENRFHAQMEGGYSLTLRDPSMSPSLRMAMEERLNYHKECQNKRTRGRKHHRELWKD